MKLPEVMEILIGHKGVHVRHFSIAVSEKVKVEVLASTDAKSDVDHKNDLGFLVWESWEA